MTKNETDALEALVRDAATIWPDDAAEAETELAALKARAEAAHEAIGIVMRLHNAIGFGIGDVLDVQKLASDFLHRLKIIARPPVPPPGRGAFAGLKARATLSVAPTIPLDAPSPVAVTREALMVRIRLHSKASLTMTEAYCAAEVALEAFAPVIAERDRLAAELLEARSAIACSKTPPFSYRDMQRREHEATSIAKVLMDQNAKLFDGALAVRVVIAKLEGERDALQARAEALEKELADEKLVCLGWASAHAEMFKAAMDYKDKLRAQPRATMDVERMRADAKRTYQGGYKEQRDLDIFTHGLDTAFNVVANQPVAPAPEPAKPGVTQLDLRSPAVTQAPAARAGEITDETRDARGFTVGDHRLGEELCDTFNNTDGSSRVYYQWSAVARRAKALLAGTGRKPVVLPLPGLISSGAHRQYVAGWNDYGKILRSLNPGIEVADG